MQNPNMQWTRSHHNWVVTRTVGTAMVVACSGTDAQPARLVSCRDQSHGWERARCKDHPRNDCPQIFGHRRGVVRPFGASLCAMPRERRQHDEEQERGDTRTDLQKDESHRKSPRRRLQAGAVVGLVQLFRETCTPSADKLNLIPTSVAMSLITTPCSFLRYVAVPPPAMVMPAPAAT
jgi:hypothetical protein